MNCTALCCPVHEWHNNVTQCNALRCIVYWALARSTIRTCMWLPNIDCCSRVFLTVNDWDCYRITGRHICLHKRNPTGNYLWPHANTQAKWPYHLNLVLSWWLETGCRLQSCRTSLSRCVSCSSPYRHGNLYPEQFNRNLNYENTSEKKDYTSFEWWTRTHCTCQLWSL